MYDENSMKSHIFWIKVRRVFLLIFLTNDFRLSISPYTINTKVVVSGIFSMYSVKYFSSSSLNICNLKQLGIDLLTRSILFVNIILGNTIPAAKGGSLVQLKSRSSGIIPEERPLFKNYQLRK